MYYSKINVLLNVTLQGRWVAQRPPVWPVSLTMEKAVLAGGKLVDRVLVSAIVTLSAQSAVLKLLILVYLIYFFID